LRLGDDREGLPLGDVGVVQFYVRAGDEVLVNSVTAGGQASSSIEAQPNGGYVIVWTDASGVGGDSDGGAIKAQLFDSSGNKAGAEFLVNTNVAGAQSEPQVAALSSGRFLVTWSDGLGSGGDGSAGAVKAQLFAADGSKIGSEFLVNTATQLLQASPAVTELGNGGFVISWTDFNPASDGSQSSIKAQIYDSQANRLGGEFIANTTTTTAQTTPAIAPLANGGFAISWADTSSTGLPGGSDIRLQRFDAAGAKLGGELLVNSSTQGSQVGPAMTALANGGFLVTWTDSAMSGTA
jgi:hypothetical protein